MWNLKTLQFKICFKIVSKIQKCQSPLTHRNGVNTHCVLKKKLISNEENVHLRIEFLFWV